jgi:SHS2 domain-containing protein
MYKIEFLSHTADIRMRVEADTKSGVFKGALIGMSELIRKDFCNQYHGNDFGVGIEIHSVDETSLLIDFLNEVLSLSHINKTIYCELDMKRLTCTDLSATIKGDHTDEWDEDIKAVTYHEAELKKINDRWNAQVIFDI